MNTVELVEKFQCPGCVCGSDTKCGEYRIETSWGIVCKSHVLGTMAFPYVGSFALGLPKGFCRPGFDSNGQHRNKIDIRLWVSGERPEWDRCNVAVWAMERDGFLFVRTFAPRVNQTWVDVIESGTLAMCPNAINVGEFYDEID